MAENVKRLEGKVALITGGASGIGARTTKLFAEHGAKVIVADIAAADDDDLLSSQHGSANPTITYIHCDVTNEQHVKNAVDKAVATYGKLDIMFNNAGISDRPKPGGITDNEKSDLERVLATNVTGVFLGMKHAARVMIPRRSGTIISTSSLSSGAYGIGTHAYTCSKHAVVGLTKNLAVELGRFGIRVNCVSPYGLNTPFMSKCLGIMVDGEQLQSTLDAPANLKGTRFEVDDVANAVVFLASDEARYLSGHNLFLDGGLRLRSSLVHQFFLDDGL